VRITYAKAEQSQADFGLFIDLFDKSIFGNNSEPASDGNVPVNQTCDFYFRHNDRLAVNLPIIGTRTAKEVGTGRDQILGGRRLFALADR
jgi:hypothetical protein